MCVFFFIQQNGTIKITNIFAWLFIYCCVGMIFSSDCNNFFYFSYFCWKTHWRHLSNRRPGSRLRTPSVIWSPVTRRDTKTHPSRTYKVKMFVSYIAHQIPCRSLVILKYCNLKPSACPRWNNSVRTVLEDFSNKSKMQPLVFQISCDNIHLRCSESFSFVLFHL